MEQLLQQIAQHRAEIDAAEAGNVAELEAFRIKYLGTKGLVRQLMTDMKHVPDDQKRAFGQVMNAFKLAAEEKHEALRNGLLQTVQDEAAGVDYTMPGHPLPLGSRHPLTLVRNKMVGIFNRLGFAVAEGPEIEDDWHNFGALNLPEYHPARDMQDTFYVSKNPDWLLRTHTSNVQIREMKKGVLPLRVVMPGRVYRNETISARAHCFFHQIEGLAVAENISFADLKQTLYFYVREMFGQDVKIRFRPSYFPFTEPSAEMDISCQICYGAGCNVCKQSGWVEILGCGMVHPNVLTNCGIDANRYTGFAFGMGIERVAMLKYQVKDLRLFSENDLRFLRQFASAV
jgi:phenylalanyl-tRNA synthetase alpha chain